MTRLEHVTITAVDFAVALRFYDATLAAIGLVRLDELVDEEQDAPEVEAAAWGRPDDDRLIWLLAGATPTTGLHLCFSTQSPADVETFYLVAERMGGAGWSEPRRWPIYRRGEFNAIVADPAGNLIEVVAPEDEER